MQNDTTQKLRNGIWALALFSVIIPSLLQAQNPPPNITPCLIRTDCNAERMAHPIAPYLWAEGDCRFASTNLNRYLSRSADIGGLTELINNDYFSTTECDAPYTFNSHTDYCPDNYCRTIQTMARLNISMLQRAFNGATFHMWEFFPGARYYNLGKQIIDDINYAYDCEGNMRPIIQGIVFEAFDPANFAYAESINGVETDTHIPTQIISAYFAAFPDDAGKIDPQSGMTFGDYYAAPRFFQLDRLAVPSIDDQGNPSWTYDIQKVEMRIWFLYQAYAMIDMGYTAIHMGLYGLYGRSADGSYSELDALTQAIRNYAQNNPNTGFVLLSGESPMENSDGGLSAMHNGHFIFDFDSRAMRPREVNQGTSGDGNWPDGCDTDIANSIQQEINASPCGGLPQMAVVDPCTIASFGGTVSGYNPQGCYIDQLPYTVHFDGFHVPVDPGVPSDGPSSLTWGFNDHQWFSSLPAECKAWWFDFFFCDRRNYHNGNGSIVIPGIIMTDTDLNDPSNESAMQLLADQAGFINLLDNQTLAPKTPELMVSEKCYKGIACVTNCNGTVAPPGRKWLIGEKSYTFKIGNKDCSSSYSIHIKDPNGNWLPPKIGDTYRVFPEVDGVYEIRIRQDNLGLPSSTFGTEETIFFRPLTSHCCLKLITDTECGKMPQLFTNCVSNIKDKAVYDFEIRTDYATTSISNVRSDLDYLNIEYANQVTPQKITGRFNIRNNNVTNVQLTLDVAEFQETPAPAVLRNTLSVCGGGSTHFRHASTEYESSLPEQDKQLKLFPNPTTGQIKIGYDAVQAESVDIQVFNMTGQLQATAGFQAEPGKNTWELNLNRLPNGCYLLSVSSAGNKSFVRFIKQD